jgi:hypothetical protein
MNGFLAGRPAAPMTSAPPRSHNCRQPALAGTAVFSRELDEPSTEGQRLVRALDPRLVWLSHAHEPWRPG